MEGDGRAHVITICVNNGTSENHITKLAGKVKDNKNIVLHIIQVDEDESIGWLDELVKQGHPNIHAYKGNLQENNDIAVLGIRQLHHVVIVDKNGLVTLNENFTDYDNLESGCEQSYK